MTSILNYFKQRPDVKPPIADYFNPGEGNRVGLPFGITSCDYNSDIHSIIFSTKTCEVVLYGSYGGSITLQMNDVTINRVLFIDRETIFVLCRDGSIVKLTISGDELVRAGKAQLNLGPTGAVDWDFYHIQRFENQAFFLVAQRKGIFRIDRDTMNVETFITNEEWGSFLGLTDTDEECEIRCITSKPNDPSIVLIIGPEGKIALHRDRRLEKLYTMANRDGSFIRQLIWSADGNVAYGIAENYKYTKWSFDFSNSFGDIFEQIQDLPVDMRNPYPSDSMEHFSVLNDQTTNRHEDDFIAYHGGKSPHSSTDHNTITIRQRTRIASFQLHGDIVAIKPVNCDQETYKSGVFIVVTTTEVVAIDMASPNWLAMRPTFFYGVHNTELTCQYRALNVDETTWNRLLKAGEEYWNSLSYSDRPWPLYFDTDKRETNKDMSSYRQVHLTGHSSGAICIYACGGLHMYCIAIIRTASEFLDFSPPNTGELAFKDYQGGVDRNTLEQNSVTIIGDYDPMGDEQSFAITNIFFDQKKGTVIATNDGGFVLSYDIYDAATCISDVAPVKISMTSPSMPSTNSIIPRNSDWTYAPGYQPTHKDNDKRSTPFQICPNVKITALGFATKLNSVIIGTDSGLVFADLRHHKLVQREDLHIQEGATNTPATSGGRFKSLKASVRKTFRRKKTTRSRRWRKTSANKGTIIRSSRRFNDDSAVPMKLAKADTDEDEPYAERQIEAKSDLPFAGPAWVVTCVKVLRFPLTNKSPVDDVIVVGTSGGKILVYKIYEDRLGDRVTFGVTKVYESRVAHGQAILNVDLSGDEGYFSAATTRLVIITDEQIRILSLPGFSKIGKYPITIREGLKIVRSTVAKLKSTKDPNAFEFVALLLTNDGDLRIQSLTHLESIETTNFLPGLDLIAQKSCVLSADGTVSCLKKCSEIHRVLIQEKHSPWSNNVLD